MFDTLTRMGAAGAGGAYEIERSLRFNSGDSPKLSHTPSSSGNLRTWTFSFWCKRSKLGGNQDILSPYRSGASGSQEEQIMFTNDAPKDQLQFYGGGGAGGYPIMKTNRVFRDTSAWYHIVIAYDSTQNTAADRINIYVNGVKETSFATETYGDQDRQLGFMRDQANYIGAYGYDSGGSNFFDGYLAEMHWVDGTQLTADSFGETNADTGQWVPIKYAGSHGSEGWYLNFSDNSNTTSATLGKDSSGNSNDWTPANFSVAAGAGNDSVIDTPTNNYCTWSRIDKHRDHISIDNGQLVPNQTWSGGFAGIRGTMGVTSGKWYFEFQCGSGTGHQIGWVNSEFNMLDSADVAITTAGTNGHGAVWDSRGYMYGWTNSGDALYPTGAHVTYTNNDVIGCAMDLDNYKFYFSKNGTFINSQDPTNGTNAIIPTGSNNDGDGTYVAGDIMQPYFTGWSNGTGETNFGQQPFQYTPPTGYQALCTENLSEPTIKKGSDHFVVKTYSGTGSTQTITTALDADLVWVKRRDSANYHILSDTVRGAGHYLVPNTSDASSDGGSQLINGFSSTGFQVGTENAVNNSSGTYVSWNWKESASAGFDIVSYTGNGSARTISHSLGVQPDFMLAKNRDQADGWQVFHKSKGSGFTQQFDGPGVFENIDGIWNNTGPTSSVFSVGDDHKTNANGEDYIIYLWSNVEGYSKAGYYKGNGNANGPFVFTGFKPQWLILKRTDAASEWNILDINRNVGEQPLARELRANLANSESGYDTTRYVDFLSNGFKLRTSDTDHNGDDALYVYMAFAERPFKHANAR